MNKKRIMLIDGSSMLVSAYYGTCPTRKEDENDETYFNRLIHTSNGIYTNAIKVMLTTILNLEKRYRPDFIGIAFDKSRNTFRKKIYPEYKGTRKETPKPLKEQMINMRSILEQIGIPTFISDTYEADDLIYSLTQRFDTTNCEIIIITKDHDYYQIVKDGVELWAPQVSEEKANALFVKYNLLDEKEQYPCKMFPITKEIVIKETGVTPELIPDWKGIVGDTSDNIPGVKGIFRAAAPLLMEYGSLEAVYLVLKQDEKEFAKKCKEMGLRSPINALKANKDNAFLSKKLATMVFVPEIRNYEIHKTKINRNELKNVIQEYELNSLSKYIY